ncbi:hypothetical protein F5Y06DRAFT_262492 [Hypoxylon sp. FL0890]|nr:hypothetical protein F5Y06DRAFT_262492 [Hypoxylon sp. FL0890]
MLVHFGGLVLLFIPTSADAYCRTVARTSKMHYNSSRPLSILNGRSRCSVAHIYLRPHGLRASQGDAGATCWVTSLYKNKISDFVPSPQFWCDLFGMVVHETVAQM